MQFGQAILHNAANKAGGMRQKTRKMFSVVRGRLLPRSGDKIFKQPQKCFRVMLRDCAVRSCIVLIGSQNAFRHYDRAVLFLAALE